MVMSSSEGNRHSNSRRQLKTSLHSPKPRGHGPFVKSKVAVGRLIFLGANVLLLLLYGGAVLFFYNRKDGDKSAQKLDRALHFVSPTIQDDTKESIDKSLPMEHIDDAAGRKQHSSEKDRAHMFRRKVQKAEFLDTSDGSSSNSQGYECESVFFWGGLKSGSTTLASLLKHEMTTGEAWDPNGQFVDLVKEYCWAIGHNGGYKNWQIQTAHNCTNSRKFALDGCPWYKDEEDAKIILTLYPNAKFVMLIRNPVDRIVSHLNEQFRRSNYKDLHLSIEDGVRYLFSQKERKEWEMSSYGKNLHTLLTLIKDPSHVLIVQMEAMQRDAQGVVDAVMAHIGGKHKDVRALHVNNGAVRRDYEHISAEARSEFANRLTPDVELLERLVGKRFSWSWTDQTQSELDGIDGDSSWLATTPLPFREETL